MEFMLDTGASCLIINYRHIQNILGNLSVTAPKYFTKSTKVTKTYSGQTVPMIGYATITFSYDPDGQFIFPLTVWITEMRTQIFLGIDFCQKQVSGIHFDLPGIEIKNHPKSICYGSFHQNKSSLQLSQILTIRTPYMMWIDAKSACSWNTFTQTLKHISHQVLLFNQIDMLWLLAYHLQNTLCTRSEDSCPILMENNKNHQIILPKGQNGFSWRGWSRWAQILNTKSLRTNECHHLHWWTVQWLFSLTINSSSS